MLIPQRSFHWKISGGITKIMLAVFSGYSGTLIYKPLCNEVLSIMNDISCPTNSRICGKEPRYNETSL